MANVLERHHLAQLGKSAISELVIAERGYRTITNKAELASIGFSVINVWRISMLI